MNSRATKKDFVINVGSVQIGVEKNNLIDFEKETK